MNTMYERMHWRDVSHATAGVSKLFQPGATLVIS